MRVEPYADPRLLGTTRTRQRALSMPVRQTRATRIDSNRLLDQLPQSRNRLVPLIGNLRQVVSSFCNRLGMDDEATFASDSTATDNARVLQHPEVFGHRLTGEIETIGEGGDGMFFTLAQARDQLEAGGAAQCCEHGSGTLASKFSS